MTYSENKKICEQFPPEIMYEGLRELIATVNATMTRVVETGDKEAANDEARVHEIANSVVNSMSPKEIDYPTAYTELQAIHDKYKNRPTNKEWTQLAKKREDLIAKGLL
jgi:IS4 transposase